MKELSLEQMSLVRGANDPPAHYCLVAVPGTVLGAAIGGIFGGLLARVGVNLIVDCWNS